MIDLIFPMVLELLKKFADGALDGQVIAQKPDLKEGLQFAYGAFMIYGDNLAALIKGNYDDRVIEAFLQFVEDTAKEGDFPLLKLVKVE